MHDHQNPRPESVSLHLYSSADAVRRLLPGECRRKQERTESNEAFPIGCFLSLAKPCGLGSMPFVLRPRYFALGRKIFTRISQIRPGDPLDPPNEVGRCEILIRGPYA